MMTSYRALCTVRVSHTYYDGACKDFHFVIPPATAALLKRGKMIAKETDGMLLVLVLADGPGAPMIPLAGETLRFGLQLANPYFSNFTAGADDMISAMRVYRNSVTPGALADPFPAAPAGRLFTHGISDTARPVTVTLRDAAGSVVHIESVADTDRTSVLLDVTGKPEGEYILEEIFPTTTTSTSYYVDAEMVRAGAVGALEIEIDTSFYTNAPSFEISFTAKEQKVKYYVVADNYSPADTALLDIIDEGADDDDRDPWAFNKYTMDMLPEGHLPVPLLESYGDNIVLFQTDAQVPRRDRGARKIQLMKSTDLLISNLPQAGPEKAHADMIIIISKP